MIETSSSINAISAALLKFQGAVDGVEKNKTNPGFKSRYANLEAVRDTAVPELQKVGIVYIQSAGAIVDGVMAMTTRLIHAETGEWIQGTMDIPLGKRDPQGMGSAQSYAQRYSLMAMLGLPAVDDDGEAAMDRPSNNRRQDAPKSAAMTYAGHLSAITSAATMDELKAAIALVNANKTLTAQDKADLAVAKDARKAALTKPADYVEPSFPGDTP
jgi:hypothetical protein